MQKSDIVSLIQARHAKTVHSELLSMLSVSKLVVLDKGEEFIMHASASGSNYSLSVLNNGIAWLIGKEETADVVTVTNDTYVTVVVINGSKVTLVFMHGMAEFTVSDYTGVYQYPSFASEKCEALLGDLREPSDYRYLNKMSLESTDVEETPSSVGTGKFVDGDIDRFSTFYHKYASRMTGAYSLNKAPKEVIRELVRANTLFKIHDVNVGTGIMVLDISNYLKSVLIAKKTELGNVILIVVEQEYYYDGPDSIIQAFESNHIVSLNTLLGWIENLT